MALNKIQTILELCTELQNNMDFLLVSSKKKHKSSIEESLNKIKTINQIIFTLDRDFKNLIDMNTILKKKNKDLENDISLFEDEVLEDKVPQQKIKEDLDEF